MSGNPTGSNVVPMPHAQAPAPAQPPMPFPMWGGGGSLPWGPGCCPPGGMDALMKCYCDVQAATAFICSVMVQCIQTNPAVTAAIIAAIEASGSSLPLIGVTNGQAAQPGQVGEFQQFTNTTAANVAAGTTQQFTFTCGVLPPGDWLVQCSCTPGFGNVENALFFLNPVPAGFSSESQVGLLTTGGAGENVYLNGPVFEALTSVPSLLACQVGIQAASSGAAAGNINTTIVAFRMR